MSQMTPAAAIEQSVQQNEIVTILVADEAERDAAVKALRAAAHSTDTAENGDVTEVWAYDADADDDSTIWRVHVEIRA